MLNIRRRGRKRLPDRIKQSLTIPEAPNQVWSIDFMSYTLVDGGRFRLFNILNDFNRESLAIELETSMPSLRVIRALNRVIAQRRKPANLRSGNGPEFISHILQQRCEDNAITLQYIQPDKPTQFAYIGRINGSIRRELLNAYLFNRLAEVMCLSE